MTEPATNEASHQRAWKKSSKSGDSGGNCVEVAKDASGMYVRDSKLGQESPIFQLNRSDWTSLTEAVSR